MNKLLFNWSILTLSNFFYQVVIFIVLLRIAKLLEPTQFGSFTIIITAVTIAQTLSSLGLQKVITREIARKPNVISEIARIAMIPTFFAIIISTAFLLAYLLMIEGISNLEILAFAGLLLFSLSLWNYFEPLAFGIQEMNISAYLNILGALALFLLIYFLPKEKFSRAVVLILYSSVFFVRSLVYFFIEWKKKYFSQSSNNIFINTKSLLKKSLPFYWNLLLGIPTVQLPILFLGQFSGPSEVGYFSIANKLAMPLNLIASNLFIAMFPILASLFIKDENVFREKAIEIFEVLVITGIIITLGIGLLSKEIIILLLGKNYLPAIPIFSLQIWAVFTLILLSYISIILSATDNEKLLAKLSVFNAILIGIICYIGANHGAVGLAISTYLGMLVGFIFHWYYIHIKLKIHLNTRFIINLLGVVLLSFITYYLKDFTIIYRTSFYIVIASSFLLFNKDVLLSNLKKIYVNKDFYGR